MTLLQLFMTYLCHQDISLNIQQMIPDTQLLSSQSMHQQTAKFALDLLQNLSQQLEQPSGEVTLVPPPSSTTSQELHPEGPCFPTSQMLYLVYKTVCDQWDRAKAALPAVTRATEEEVIQQLRWIQKKSHSQISMIFRDKLRLGETLSRFLGERLKREDMSELQYRRDMVGLKQEQQQKQTSKKRANESLNVQGEEKNLNWLSQEELFNCLSSSSLNREFEQMAKIRAQESQQLSNIIEGVLKLQKETAKKRQEFTLLRSQIQGEMKVNPNKILMKQQLSHQEDSKVEEILSSQLIKWLQENQSLQKLSLIIQKQNELKELDQIKESGLRKKPPSCGIDEALKMWKQDFKDTTNQIKVRLQQQEVQRQNEMSKIFKIKDHLQGLSTYSFKKQQQLIEIFKNYNQSFKSQYHKQSKYISSTRQETLSNKIAAKRLQDIQSLSRMSQASDYNYYIEHLQRLSSFDQDSNHQEQKGPHLLRYYSCTHQEIIRDQEQQSCQSRNTRKTKKQRLYRKISIGSKDKGSKTDRLLENSQRYITRNEQESFNDLSAQNKSNLL